MIKGNISFLSKNLLFFFLLGSACLAIATPAPKLTVVTEEWPPYNFLNSEGVIDGSATKKVKAILADANIDYHMELLAWNRAYKKTRDNKNVLLYSIYRSEKRLKDFNWICPLIQTSAVNFYTLASRTDMKITKVEDAKKYVLGVIGSGWTYDHLVHNGFSRDKNLDVGSSEFSNVRKLMKGRIDIVVQQEDLIRSKLAEENLPLNALKVVYTLSPAANQIGCMVMSKDTPKSLVDKIRKSLNNVNKLLDFQ